MRCSPRWPTGRSTIAQYSQGADCAATLDCLGMAGVEIRRTRSADRGLTVEIEGRGLRGLRAAEAPLDARNSGTTMRLLSGVLAAHPFTSVVVGDASLTRRPMGRVIVPLQMMGARIESVDKKPPLTIHGARAERHPLSDRGPERPGEERGAARRPAGLRARQSSKSRPLRGIIPSSRCARSAPRCIPLTARLRLREGRR